MNLLPITVTILTKDSQRYLTEVLTALREFDEILIYDTGSKDKTLEFAREYPNVTIYQKPFIGFGPTHNQASALARNDWILSIDSDEVVTTEMMQAIAKLTLQPEAVYSFPRNNYYHGKFIRWCGWYPDRQVRLYNRTTTRFTNAQVHEAVITTGMQHIQLTAPMIHYSYGSISDFLTKMQTYSTLFAEQNRGKKKSSPWKAITHGWFAFFKSYIIKRGFMGGYEGFVISSYNGITAFYKYLKLYEANENLP